MKRGLLLIIAIVILAALTLLTSFSVLPPAPLAPTPTWPLGINLPDKLPHIPN